MMFHALRVRTAKTDLVTAANEKREQLFGKLTANVTPLKLSFLSKSTQTFELGKEMLL